MAEEGLDSLVLKIQGLLNEAQEDLREFQLAGLKKRFDREGRPLMERFSLSGGRVLEIPRYSLVPQSYLGIDEVEVRFAIPAAPDEVKGFQEAAGVVEKKPGFFRKFFARLGKKRTAREMIEVKVMFRAGTEKQGA